MAAVNKEDSEMSPGQEEALLVLRTGSRRVKRAKMLQASTNLGSPVLNILAIAGVPLANGEHGEDRALFAYSDLCATCTSLFDSGELQLELG